MSAELVIRQGDIAIYELLASDDEERLEAMLTLYAKFFPEYEHYVPRMRRRAAFAADKRPGHTAHYWLIEYQGEPVGLSTFRYIAARECGIGVSFAIKPAARKVEINKQRLSLFVILEIMRQLNADADAVNGELYGMVTEVEYRSLMEHYKTMGMLELPVKYFEPIYPPEKEGDSVEIRINNITFESAILALVPNNREIKFFNTPLLKNLIKAFLIDHYELPDDHDKVQAALASIKRSERRGVV